MSDEGDDGFVSPFQCETCWNRTVHEEHATVEISDGRHGQVVGWRCSTCEPVPFKTGKNVLWVPKHERTDD